MPVKPNPLALQVGLLVHKQPQPPLETTRVFGRLGTSDPTNFQPRYDHV